MSEADLRERMRSMCLAQRRRGLACPPAVSRSSFLAGIALRGPGRLLSCALVLRLCRRALGTLMIDERRTKRTTRLAGLVVTVGEQS